MTTTPQSLIYLRMKLKQLFLTAPFRNGARALARFSVHYREMLEIPSPLPVCALKRRERRAPLFLAALLLPGSLLAADGLQTIPLWSNGAPGFESRKDIPEQAASYWVKNINNPSLTVFLPPKEKANGAAVVICPGGGFRELVFNGEGVDPAKYFNNLGVAAFVLKYRLFRETNSVYTSENAREDGLRALRLVRSRAIEWGIDTNRI